jgi:hypothetical protein
MPVRYGIVCDRCSTLHLVSGAGKASRVRYDRQHVEFKVICIPPCDNIISFQRGMLVPYIVPDEAIERGYVDVDDCRPVAKIDKISARQ